MNNPTRRDVLRWSAAIAAASIGSRLYAAEPKPLKVLFFTKSSGYEHSVIARKSGELGYAEKILIQLGKTLNFDVTASKDGRLFEPDTIDAFDAFVFYTTGDLTRPGYDKQPAMSVAGKRALLDAVHGGKGFFGIHSATDTFHSHGNAIDPYIAMLGGEFVAHGNQQSSTQRVIDSNFPGLKGQANFELVEEWYTLKNFADNLHVLLETDTGGMQGAMYQRPPYPSTWARMHGSGRVMYTSLGHREDVWTNPIFVSLLTGGLNWITGRVPADVKPTTAPVMK